MSDRISTLEKKTQLESDIAATYQKEVTDAAIEKLRHELQVQIIDVIAAEPRPAALADQKLRAADARDDRGLIGRDDDDVQIPQERVVFEEPARKTVKRKRGKGAKPKSRKGAGFS